MNFWPFRRRQCRHPLHALWVKSEETKRLDPHPSGDAVITTYHFKCRLCGRDDLQVRHAKVNPPSWLKGRG